MRKELKSIRLTITPEMDIVVTCPQRVSIEQIESFLKRKWRWMDKQLDFFEKYQKKVYRKEYVSGESFYYLGRQYQFIIQKGDTDDVSLTRDKMIVSTTETKSKKTYIKQLIEMWYKQEARDIFRERFEIAVKHFGYRKNILLRIVQMRRKWGNCNGSTVTLNPLLIQARTEAIDYVIAHELCHIRHKDHGKNFWKYLDTMYPGWEKEKEKLEIQFG